MSRRICPVWALNKAWGPSGEADTLDPYYATKFFIESLGRLTEEHVVSVLNRTVAYSFFLYIEELPASPFTTLYLNHDHETHGYCGRTEMECRWPWGDSRLYCIEYPLASIAEYKSGRPRAELLTDDDPLKCASFSVDTLLDNRFCSDLIFCLETWLESGMRMPVGKPQFLSKSEMPDEDVRPELDEYMTTREACDEIKRSRATLIRWARKAGVTSVDLGKWRKSDIEFLKSTKGIEQIRPEKGDS